MRRRRKPEGVTLDLTLWTEGTPFVVEELVVAPKTPLAQFTEAWAIAAYKKACEFCERPGAHYDHINMFDKEGDVCRMILEGRPREEVEAEIAKCQFLCRTCHAKVTREEQKQGFITAKRKINKLARSGVDVAAEREGLRAEYAVAMAPVYAGLKGTAFPTVDD
jgi:hypothetical protein